MFKVTVQTLSGNEFDIYYPGDKDYVLSNAVLTYDVGLAGEFNFTIPFGHPSYDQIVYDSIITVYKDNVEFWRGDIRNIKTKFDKSLEVYCLEDLAWLGDEPIAMVQITNQTYAQRFSNALNIYNSNQVAKRKFSLGRLTAVPSSDFCNWIPEYGMTLLDGFRRFIAGSNGYLKVRRVISNGTLARKIDIVGLNIYGKRSSQTIEFGSNLLDYTKNFDATNIINVLYPYGAETETELYEDIMQRIVGTPIQNDESISTFGRRAKSVVFDTDDETTLNNLASAYLSRYSQPHIELEVSAVDLGSISNVDEFEIGDSVRVLAPTYGIDQWLYITHMDVDLLNPANNQINLADELRKASLTSQVATQAEDLKDIRTPASVLDEAKRNAWSIIEGDNGGIVTFDVNGEEQIVGIRIANNLDIDQATMAWGWNVNGLAYLHREYPSDEWQVGIAMTMNGEIVADYITAGEMSADRINGGHIRANLITALNGTTTVGANTLEDFATKASTIIDVDVEYAKNQSSTTAPTSGWSTSSPQWEEGYYIWQRTKTTDGNNQASYSTPVCIQGADGQAGPAGVGVSAIVEQYYLSTSDQTPTGGSWSINQPAWVEGKYIWTRSLVTWTNGTTTDTDPVLAKAINGANESVKDLDDDLDQDGIMYRLVGNSKTEGIYLENNHVYVNASMINVGTLSADRIRGGYFMIGGVDNVSGKIVAYNTSSTVVTNYLVDSSHTFTFEWAQEPGQPFEYLSVIVSSPSASTNNIVGRMERTNLVDPSVYYDLYEGDNIFDFESGNIYIRNYNGNSFRVSVYGRRTALELSNVGIKGESAVFSKGSINDFTFENRELSIYDGYVFKTGSFDIRTTNRTIFTFKPSNFYLKGNSAFSMYIDVTFSANPNTTVTALLQRYESSSWVGKASASFSYSSTEQTVLFNGEQISISDTANWRVVVYSNAASTSTRVNYVLHSKSHEQYYPAPLKAFSASKDGIYGVFKGRFIGRADDLNFLVATGTVDLNDVTIDSDEITNGHFVLSDSRVHTSNDIGHTELGIVGTSASSAYGQIQAFVDDFNYIDIETTTPTIEVYKSQYSYIRATNSLIRIQSASGTYAIFQGSSNLSAYRSGTDYYINWTQGSDERIKDDIESLDTELSRKLIDATETKKFRYKNEEGKHYGMIAQEARKVLDSLGETDALLEYHPDIESKEVPDYMAIHYEEYIPHLINYVKDLRAEIVALKNIINTLKEDK